MRGTFMIESWLGGRGSVYCRSRGEGGRGGSQRELNLINISKNIFLSTLHYKVKVQGNDNVFFSGKNYI